MKKFICILSASIFMLACGSSTSDEKKEEASKPQAEAPAPQDESSAVSNTVVLTVGDLIQFDITEIRVKSGEKVTLTINHTGSMLKQVMGHNFVLLKPGTDIPTFGLEAMQAIENDYIPEGSDAVIAHTKMLGGGESDTIEFDPPAPGTYDYICSFPGHYGIMKGKLIVE